MGQIIGSAAKPKRCNANQLSQVPTPAAGEHILVSSDNSMNAVGQGNFDCYIEGDGHTAATALELKNINELKDELFYIKTSSTSIEFNNIGYYINGTIGSSNAYRYSDIINLKKGDRITGTSRGTQFDIITDASVEGSYTTILVGHATTTNPQSVDYVTPKDIKVIVSAWVNDINSFAIVKNERIYKYKEAEAIGFDDTNSNLGADNVQDAIDKFVNSLFAEDITNLNFANIGGYYYNGVLKSSNVYGYTNILSLKKGDRITGTSRGSQFDIITDASVEGNYTTILAGNATTQRPQTVDYTAPNDIDIIVSAWVEDMASFVLTRAALSYKYKDAETIQYDDTDSEIGADNVQAALSALSKTTKSISTINDDFFGIHGGKITPIVKNDNAYIKYSGTGLETASNELYYMSNPIRLYAGQKVTIKTYGYGDVSFITKCDENGNYETGVENSLLNGTVYGSEYIKVFETIINSDCYAIFSLPYLNTEVSSTYVAAGAIITRDNLANYNTRRRFSPCKYFGVQPAANGTDFAFNPETQGYDNLLANIYEPLRTSNPNYITRTNIGKDASGAIDMYVYEFTPRYYQQHILLIAGVHGNEVDGVVCLARIMQLITNADETDNDLYFLRNNVRITVLPALNVWGISQHANKRTNAANQEMQGWNWNPEPVEITNFRTYLDGVYETISFGISMHTTVTDVYNDFYGVIKPHAHNVRTIFRVNDWLCRNYAKNGATVDDQYLGWLNWRNGDNMEIDYWYVHYGFVGSIMELSDKRWGALHSSAAITMGVTMWLNYIIQQVNDFYIPKKLIWDIPEEDYRESRE